LLLFGFGFAVLRPLRAFDLGPRSGCPNWGIHLEAGLGGQVSNLNLKSFPSALAAGPVRCYAAPMDHTPDRQQAEAPRQRHWPGFFWMLTLAPLLYLLSSGPALKLSNKHILSDKLFGFVYSPLEYLANTSTTFNSLFAWYLIDIWHCTPD
jgi:hypothetical protein